MLHQKHNSFVEYLFPRMCQHFNAPEEHLGFSKMATEIAYFSNANSVHNNSNMIVILVDGLWPKNPQGVPDFSSLHQDDEYQLTSEEYLKKKNMLENYKQFINHIFPRIDNKYKRYHKGELPILDSKLQAHKEYLDAMSKSAPTSLTLYEKLWSEATLPSPEVGEKEEEEDLIQSFDKCRIS